MEVCPTIVWIMKRQFRWVWKRKRETALESLKSCIEKKDADGIGFLQNVIKIIDAIEKFADIYAEKAKELGRTDIYEIFQRIPKNGDSFFT